MIVGRAYALGVGWVWQGGEEGQIWDRTSWGGFNRCGALWIIACKLERFGMLEVRVTPQAHLIYL